MKITKVKVDSKGTRCKSVGTEIYNNGPFNVLVYDTLDKDAEVLATILPKEEVTIDSSLLEYLYLKSEGGEPSTVCILEVE